MAIRSTVADSVLGALGSIGQQALNTQQYIAAEQTIQENAKKLTREEQADLVSKIEELDYSQNFYKTIYYFYLQHHY